MTQEEKQLLLKDLCARLPYGVVVEITSDGGMVEASYKMRLDAGLLADLLHSEDDFMPYLRPMSSMTKEEQREYFAKDYLECIDWLLEHHFDFRRLIGKGLALEAPDGMYNKEESEKESEIPIPKTVDEAVKTLAKILSEEDRDYLLENGAISMHDSLGRWIRNEWGLWTGSELKDEMMNMNKGLNHPDDMSNYIIEEFIKYWNNKL